MAQHIKADGTINTVFPKDGKHFTLEELQHYVGGYIELITINDTIDMWLNEESKLEGLPPNKLATQIVECSHPGFILHDYVAGDVLLTNRSDTKQDEDEDENEEKDSLDSKHQIDDTK